MPALRPPIHPGEILWEEFMKPLNITQNGLGVAIGIPPTRVHEIIHGRRGISADTALRLARYFGTSHELWMGLQSGYDVEVAKRALADEIARIRPLPRPDLVEAPAPKARSAAERGSTKTATAKRP